MAVVVIAGWAALALLFAATNSLTYLATGRPALWGLTIRMALSDWMVWAALTFPVLWLARRFSLTKDRWLRRLPLHIVVAIAIAIGKVAVDRWIRRAVFGFPVSYFLISSLAPHFVIYWIIVAAAHGLTYYTRSRESAVQASQLEARLAEARLQLLQMQLQPHFLFNTLHAISELVHEDPEAADRMIAALSALLREALDAGSVRQVPLARELQLVRRYLEIQTARFGERLTVTIDADPRVSEWPLPSLILQPLVENAVTHGFGSRAAAGHIAIVATSHDGSLVVEVSDNGAGLADRADLREGVGLGNTRARLHELYGGRASLEVERQSSGVMVRMTIPAAADPT
jgi:two-component system, LytTR family, sensor kinase